MDRIKRPPTMKEIMWDHYEATLRDDFAKASMQSYYSTDDDDIRERCEIAYKIADAMLLARKKKA